MDEATIRRTEAIIDFGSAAALGAAVAWLCAQLGLGLLPASAAGVSTLAAAFAGLSRIRPRAIPFRLAPFDPSGLEPAELLLTQADRAPPAATGGPSEAPELVLDDALPPAAPDSRVVRLFDAGAMPTPGEIKARIDRHLGAPQSAAPDATQALFDALAELRSSLR